jgi:hypothetical protein
MTARALGMPAGPASGPQGAGGRFAPIRFIYSHFHNAIRAELDLLAARVKGLEAQQASAGGSVEAMLAGLRTGYKFLEQVYKYHSNVEDEVRGPAAAQDANTPLSTVATTVANATRLARAAVGRPCR